MAMLDITNFTRRPAPRAPFVALAESALPDWEISLAFVGSARAKSLNRTLRRKDYVPNVLSYESGKKSGEVIICLDVAEKQAKSYGMTYRQFVPYLFIHGLMHLKGHPHGPTMERRERELLSRHLGVHLSNEKTAHRNRH
jgi:rRNA maturation RNase YbeY